MTKRTQTVLGVILGLLAGIGFFLLTVNAIEERSSKSPHKIMETSSYITQFRIAEKSYYFDHGYYKEGELHDLVNVYKKENYLDEDNVLYLEHFVDISLNDKNEFVIKDLFDSGLNIVKTYCHGEYSSALGCNEDNTIINIGREISLYGEYVKYKPQSQFNPLILLFIIAIILFLHLVLSRR